MYVSFPMAEMIGMHQPKKRGIYEKGTSSPAHLIKNSNIVQGGKEKLFLRLDSHKRNMVANPGLTAGLIM